MQHRFRPAPLRGPIVSAYQGGFLAKTVIAEQSYGFRVRCRTGGKIAVRLGSKFVYQVLLCLGKTAPAFTLNELRLTGNTSAGAD